MPSLRRGYDLGNEHLSHIIDTHACVVMSIKELLLRRTARLLLHHLIRVNNLIEKTLHISKVNILRKCYDFNCLVILPLESTPAVVGTVGDSI